MGSILRVISEILFQELTITENVGEEDEDQPFGELEDDDRRPLLIDDLESEESVNRQFHLN